MSYHKRLGHLSFSVLNKMYLALYKHAYKNKLVCDGCEFEKIIMSSYISSENRSLGMFDFVHLDVYGVLVP
jgi:GAG-pre-integrase domain